MLGDVYITAQQKEFATCSPQKKDFKSLFHRL